MGWRRDLTMAMMIVAPGALSAAMPQSGPPRSAAAADPAASRSATPLRLRQDAPALDADAKALTPQALGDALLAPGHEPVTGAAIGPQGMEPPPAPGRSTPTRVVLSFRPTPSEAPGFCRRTIATTYLPSADPSTDAGASEGRPVGLSTQTAYRWVGTGRTAATCGGPKSAFFVPTVETTDRALEAVRLLAMASAAAMRGGRTRFPVSVEDRMGAELLAYRQHHPDLPPVPGLRVVTDAPEALASLSLGTVTFVGPADRAYPQILQPSDLTPPGGRPGRGMTVFLGGEWSAGMVVADGRIVRLRLRREIPARF